MSVTQQMSQQKYTVSPGNRFFSLESFRDKAFSLMWDRGVTFCIYEASGHSLQVAESPNPCKGFVSHPWEHPIASHWLRCFRRKRLSGEVIKRDPELFQNAVLPSKYSKLH